jgi:hypothetical protein
LLSGGVLAASCCRALFARMNRKFFLQGTAPSPTNGRPGAFLRGTVFYGRRRADGTGADTGVHVSELTTTSIVHFGRSESDDIRVSGKSALQAPFVPTCIFMLKTKTRYVRCVMSPAGHAAHVQPQTASDLLYGRASL